MMKKQWFIIYLLFLAVMLVWGASGQAQYFGRNRVKYENFDFKILKTEHFDIYYYPEVEQVIDHIGRMAERWYVRLSQMLDHPLKGRQPLILYASQPHFQQTDVVSGIGEGTGGVTEASRRRVIMPIAGSLKETDHVLGHELVHAFQYDISNSWGPLAATMGPLNRMPLWMVEGMAEYLSVGPNDPLTAMWMRDALWNDDMPDIDEMASTRYFPYRFGHALWAYLGGRFGDDVVGNVMKNVKKAKKADDAFARNLPVALDSLSKPWHASLQAVTDSVAARTRIPEEIANRIGQRQKWEYQMAPSLSPDGRRVVFISTRDLFSLDLYLEDLSTGKIRRLTTMAVNSEMQSLQFLYSSGSWDATGRYFVYAGISKTEPILVVLDAETGNTVREYPLPDLQEIFHPTWSPDGSRIAFSGLKSGLTDLFILDTETRELSQLTEDLYAELQPAWSPDGSSIAIVTDRFSTDLEKLSFGDYQLALVDPESGGIQHLPAFDRGKHINPQWSPDSRIVYFISDRDGISNLYLVNRWTKEVAQVTNLFTGVSGITAVSPAVSVAQDSGYVAFSAYHKGQFNLYMIQDSGRRLGEPVANRFAEIEPAMLPPHEKPSRVASLVNDPNVGLPDSVDFPVTSYKPRLKLDYISPPTLMGGVDRYGSFIGGGTSFGLSDMLGGHQILGQVSANSRLKDIGALLGYVNRVNRLNWGIFGQNTPYSYVYYNYGYFMVDDEPAYVEQMLLYKQTIRSLSGSLYYPFSRVQRLEFSAGFSQYSFDAEVRTIANSLVDGEELIDETEELNAPDPLYLGQASVAWVYDNSLYGLATPVLGSRFRAEIAPSFGTIDYTTMLFDARRYFLPKQPFTLAMRLMHYGRYGGGAEDNRFYPLYIGYQSSIRGYDTYSLEDAEYNPDDPNAYFDYNRLFGSRAIVANFEVRFPLLGLFGLGSGYYGYLPVEAGAFFDVGLAWDSTDKAWFLGGNRKPLKSYGLVFRLALFGLGAVEFDIVNPIDRPGKNWVYQVGISTGF
jgi:Tol biopolymer transport system component